MNAELQQLSQRVRELVDRKLAEILPEQIQGKNLSPESPLYAAMRYSVLGGGKRVRPLLCFASAQLIMHEDSSLNDKAILAGACAVELIHAYSLVHDDLPAMDDDDLRRGRPTTHKKFDEATAILAGDALQTLAFSVLSQVDSISEKSVIRAISILAESTGVLGMAGGQMVDIGAQGNQLTLDELAYMHRMKTGALIKASVMLGAILSDCDDPQILDALSIFSDKIGLAFQIQDDILDCTASTEVLGKQQGSDQERGKPTYVSLLGLEGARMKLKETHREALACLDHFEEETLLAQIADYIVARAN